MPPKNSFYHPEMHTGMTPSPVVTNSARPYNLSVMSSTASSLEVRRRNPVLRILYYSVCALLVIVLVAVWGLYWYARLPLPQLDGSVSVPGISSKVHVVRDEQGVPMIELPRSKTCFSRKAT